MAAGIDTFTERWFSLRQLGVNRGLSVEKMRRLFAHEPGVLRIPTSKPVPGRRPRFTMRVPESVARRVFQRMTVPPRA